METFIYFVRHAESVFVEGNEKARGLTERGSRDAQIIKERLSSEKIDLFYSSPYKRAIDTIYPAAIDYHQEIHIVEDLRERTIGNFEGLSFQEAKHRVLTDMTFAFPQGESSFEAQSRAVKVLHRVIDVNLGQRIVIGTHGDIMTLMLNNFDKQYGYDFWEMTSMPDLYKVRIKNMKLLELSRMWR